MPANPKATLEQLLRKPRLPSTVEEHHLEEGLLLEVKTDDSGRLIGRQGQTLSDLQYLVNRMIFQQDPQAPKVLVDVGGYRSQTREALIHKAKEAAEKVRRWGDVVELEPMNAFDRRIVHNVLKDDPGVETHSVEVEGTDKKGHSSAAETLSQTLEYLQSEDAERGIEIGLLVNFLLYDAIKAGASDVHIEPWENTLVVRVRLNGVLTELIHLPLDLMEKISGRFKVMANLVSYQSSLPQEGHASGGPELGGVELRISVFPTTRGEKIVVRIFDPRNRSFDLATLGFDDFTLKHFLKLLARPNGLILLTGPTGSGKTTAIYAALHHIVERAGPAVSVSTVEDPVEFNLPMISQTQINPAQDFTYPRALRSLMRQDPQVIMVGEVRDAETAAIAIQAGLTGHLVISTIHSGNAAGVFARLINMEIEPFLLASSIMGVLGIRLLRKTCSACAEAYQPEPALLRLLPDEALGLAQFRRGLGCSHCMQTGFDGRFAVTELLMPDEVLRDAIMLKKPTRVLHEIAVQQGLRTMWQNGLHRVLKGETTLEEVVRVISMDQL